MIAYGLTLILLYGAIGLVMGGLLTMLPFPKKNEKHRIVAFVLLLIFWLPLACLTLVIAPVITIDSLRAHY